MFDDGKFTNFFDVTHGLNELRNETPFCSLKLFVINFTGFENIELKRGDSEGMGSASLQLTASFLLSS